MHWVLSRKVLKTKQIVITTEYRTSVLLLVAERGNLVELRPGEGGGQGAMSIIPPDLSPNELPGTQKHQRKKICC